MRRSIHCRAWHRQRREERQISVVTDLSDELPRAQVDRIQLQQVILNLVANAIDAMSYAATSWRCPLLAQSGHPWLHRTCPLLGVKRTWQLAAGTLPSEPPQTATPERNESVRLAFPLLRADHAERRHVAVVKPEIAGAVLALAVGFRSVFRFAHKSLITI